MFIKNLKIVNRVDDYILRDVEFHKGANLVIDTDSSKKHNKVGKTTFLKLIDVALGANDRKNIYYDSETNSTEEKLEQYITENKTAVQLNIVDNIEEVSEEHFLEVGLYKGGHYSIDSKKIKQQEYRENLKKIFFKVDETKPTFRQLINSFVRISMSGDTTAFLRNLPRTSNANYRAVYNFLFDISDPKIDEERGEIQKKLRAMILIENQFRDVQHVQEISEIKQIISALKNEREIVHRQLGDIVSEKDFKANRERLSSVREQYSNLSIQIEQLQYQLKNNKDLIFETQTDEKNSIDDNLTKSFFNEVKEILPTVKKSFDDLVLFNQQLYKNKLIYLKEVRDETSAQILKLEKQKNTLVQGNRTLLALVENDKLDEYNELAQKLSQRDREISEQEQILNTLEAFNVKKNEYERKIEKLTMNNNDSTYLSKLECFNKYFTRFAEQINGERPLLTYNPDSEKFPLSIRELSGTSTGTRKSLIAAYDLAYQNFAEVEKKKIPNFIIHDVLENIEGSNLKTTLNMAESIGTQYIVAVLKEKLTSSGIDGVTQERLHIVKLSETKKVFYDSRNNNLTEDTMYKQRGKKQG
ncbi:DUF2326 domain-containing protein [Lactiplantibacillus mudanjiangensis]|uniref:DUF2326 domain-containing protein n=1 Tax=Lactiplantibacillus mudanjiangensis TaxID=1296538 RepID=A0A660DU77_9LACO|nr:DUF2326 domain-containing protein [Lactiplantibacillus mudanjiangensis]VDG22713.1 hypothetical protein [Lactobacillus koreensis] [Lactiplantibacillus mudanjiangensis]VDG26749.1 hypothetical protein [Lactobacillus koreensis] [Lactiplantibacillus mudanjiangensis]